MAILASLYANAHRDEKKRVKPFKPADFIPGANSTEDGDRQSPEQMRASIEQLAIAFGAKRIEHDGR